MIRSEAVLGLPDYEITGIEEREGWVRISARYKGPISCPHCGGNQLRLKDRRMRLPRHESWGTRRSLLQLETRKWRCQGCQRSFWQRFPGILPRLPGHRAIPAQCFDQKHFDGISRSRLAQRETIASATVERWFHGLSAAAWRRNAIQLRMSADSRH